MPKDIILEIRGRKLLFGRGGFYEHIKDVVKTDPIEWMNEMFNRFKKTDDGKWEITSVIDEVIPYAYAGINLQCDELEEDNVPIEKVRKWVRILTFEEYGKIINAAVESLVMENANGLGERVTQPVS